MNVVVVAEQKHVIARQFPSGKNRVLSVLREGKTRCLQCLARSHLREVNDRTFVRTRIQIL
jgi:hypothetical protein